MRAAQAARSIADPDGGGSIWPRSARLGDGEDGEGREDGEEEGGRHWRDKGLRWAPKEHAGKDGYTCLTHAGPAGPGRG